MFIAECFMLVDIYVGLYTWCLIGSMWNFIMQGSVKKVWLWEYKIIGYV